MNFTNHSDGPIVKADESRAVEYADGTSFMPTSAAFFLNRGHSQYAPTKDAIRDTYGSVREHVFDANGHRMGLLTAPGLDPRKELHELIEHFRAAGEAGAVRGITQWMQQLQRGAAPAP